MVAKFPPLVSVGWLAARLPAVKVIDASWYLPAMGRDARGEYATQRIPGARFFDLDDTDDTSGLPHMLPSTEHFAQCMSSLGVRTGDHVICYDGKGIFSAPRLWWMLRANGHPEASVLDGGLPAWVAEGHPVDQSPPPPPLEGKPSEFAASLQPGAVWPEPTALAQHFAGHKRLPSALLRLRGGRSVAPHVASALRRVPPDSRLRYGSIPSAADAGSHAQVLDVELLQHLGQQVARKARKLGR